MIRPPPRSTLFPYTTLFLSLVAVSKTHPSEIVREAIASGVTDLGENRVQEADEKIPEVGRGFFHQDRKSTRLNSSHTVISYAVFCSKKKKKNKKYKKATE